MDSIQTSRGKSRGHKSPKITFQPQLSGPNATGLSMRQSTHVVREEKIKKPLITGTIGELLNANTTKNNWNIFQYRVDFYPPQDSKSIQKEVLSEHKVILSKYLFDGTVLISRRKHQKDVLELTFKRTFDDTIIIFTVKFIKEVAKNTLKHKIKLWASYEPTIVMFENILLKRIEIPRHIMRQDTVLDFFHKCYSDKGDRMDLFKTGIIGKIVYTSIDNNTYMIDDVISDLDLNSSFKKTDGTSMTFRDYYREKWNVEIRGGNQPLLVSKKKKSLNKDEEELIYLIPEFCNMTGSYSVRSNYRLVGNLATHTRVIPTARIVKLNAFIKHFLENPDYMRSLQNYNMTPKNNLVEIQSNHIRNNIMYTGAVLKCWVVLAPQKNIAEVNAFLRSIKMASDRMYFQLPQPKIVTLSDNRPQAYVRELEHIITEKNPYFILVVMDSNQSNLYAVIKRKLCVDRAVPSQVILLRNVQNNNPTKCANIAIKIICQLGGFPWRIDIPVKGMMIVGFHVCNDKKRDSQSYGAFVSTMDEHNTSYFSCVQPHPKGEDISGFFGNCMIQAIDKYQNQNNVFPTSVVIYRDGVFDEKFSHVYSAEVSAVKKCCKSILGDNFSMAFIVVSKGISSRLSEEKNGKNGELSCPPPGTVVDSVVKDPSLYDFYLVPQRATHVNVSPNHYTVIEDNLKNWSADHMQKLTYKLTLMNYYYSDPVRVPAPCQLARKLAYLTATTLKSIPHKGLEESLYYL